MRGYGGVIRPAEVTTAPRSLDAWFVPRASTGRASGCGLKKLAILDIRLWLNDGENDLATLPCAFSNSSMVSTPVEWQSLDRVQPLWLIMSVPLRLDHRGV